MQHCNTLQHTASHCNTLLLTATHCNTLQPTATHCNPLQHTATHYTTLQHTATHCNTLQRTATHANALFPRCCLRRTLHPTRRPGCTRIVITEDSRLCMAGHGPLSQQVACLPPGTGSRMCCVRGISSEHSRREGGAWRLLNCC